MRVIRCAKNVLELWALKALGSGLGGTQRLQHLSLKFFKCSSMATLEGFEALAELKELQHCSLDFSETQIQDAKALGSKALRL